MKFCKDCRWIALDNEWAPDTNAATEFAHCHRPLVPVHIDTDLVTGRKILTPSQNFVSCRIERGNYNIETKCGPDAKYFEEYPKFSPVTGMRKSWFDKVFS